MSVDAQESEDPRRRRRTDEAMRIDQPLHNPRVAPRVVPILVTVLIGVALILILWFMQR